MPLLLQVYSDQPLFVAETGFLGATGACSTFRPSRVVSTISPFALDVSVSCHVQLVTFAPVKSAFLRSVFLNVVSLITAPRKSAAINVALEKSTRFSLAPANEA